MTHSVTHSHRHFFSISRPYTTNRKNADRRCQFLTVCNVQGNGDGANSSIDSSILPSFVDVPSSPSCVLWMLVVLITPLQRYGTLRICLYNLTLKFRRPQKSYNIKKICVMTFASPSPDFVQSILIIVQSTTRTYLHHAFRYHAAIYHST